MEYPGAEIEPRPSGWWIVADNGEFGPFASYDDASAEAEQVDDVPFNENSR